MRNTEQIIATGTAGHLHRTFATVEKTKYGTRLIISTTYADSRNPDDQRIVFQQHFPDQASFDRFVDFLNRQR